MNPKCELPGCGLEMEPVYVENGRFGGDIVGGWVCVATPREHELSAKLAESEAKVKELEAKLAEADRAFLKFAAHDGDAIPPCCFDPCTCGLKIPESAALAREEARKKGAEHV